MISGSVLIWQPTIETALNNLEQLEAELFPAVDDLNLSRSDLVGIILAIIQRESGGQSGIVGDNGCSYGLMQFNWCVRRNGLRSQEELKYPGLLYGQLTWLLPSSPEDLFNAYINIAVGSRFFLTQLNRFGDVNTAILAYNATEKTAQWVNGDLPAPVNQSYLDGVLSILEVPISFFAGLVKKKAA